MRQLLISLALCAFSAQCYAAGRYTPADSGSLDGQWETRNQQFQVTVWVTGDVVCGHLDETNDRGKGNSSFIVGRLKDNASVVEFDSTWGDGRGVASLSIVGHQLKWKVLKKIDEGYTPPDKAYTPLEARLSRVLKGNQWQLERKWTCEDWQPVIESGQTNTLDLRELGGVKP